MQCVFVKFVSIRFCRNILSCSRSQIQRLCFWKTLWKMVGFRPADVPPSAAVKFVGAGTAACIADLLTFPLDTAKVRLQVLKYSCVTNTKPILVTLVAWTFIAQIQGETRGSAATGSGSTVKYRGVFGTIATMVRTEGPLSLYSGLVAGLQRQMSFASVRIGLYDSVKQFYTKGSDREHLWLDSDSCLFGWGEILTSLNWHLSLPWFRCGHWESAAGWIYHRCLGGCHCSAHRRGESSLPGTGQMSWPCQALL